MVKKKRASQTDDYITNKILGVFSFAFLLILGLMATYRGYARVDTIAITINGAYVVAAVAAVLTVAGIVWEYASARKGIDTKYKLICGKHLAVVSAFTAFCAFIAARFFVDGIKALYIIVPAAAVLTLIYLIYSTEFFLIASLTSAVGLLMWYLSNAYYSKTILQIPLSELLRDYTFYAAVLVLLALLVTAAVIFAASKHNGTLKIAGKGRQVFTATANYPLMYISIALTAICTVAALVFGAAIAYYLIFVVFGYLFILAIYYTVKLM